MSRNGSKLNILFAESNSEVLASQVTDLQKAGHSVEQAVGRKAVEQALRGKAFDLVILGHTLSKDDRHHLPYMVKKSNSQTRVVVLHSGGRHHEVDATLDPGQSVEKLLQIISSLAEKPVLVSR
jgi:DNA-binding NtrC family response regulator